MTPSHSAHEEATAYHEAGHAVVGAVLNRPPIFVTIIPDELASGKNEFPDDCLPQFKNYLDVSPEKQAYIETRILIRIAGTIAHNLRFPDRITGPADAYDEHWARTIIEQNASWAGSDPDSYFRQLQETARRLLQADWPWVEVVARALIDRKTIGKVEVMELRPSE
jgi:Peptidase family M41